MVDELGAWLANELKEHGWSMSEMGRRAGYSSTHISDVINGTANPSADFAIRIAKALGERPEHLLRLAGHLPAAPPPTNHDEAVLAAYRSLSPARQQAIAVLLDLAGTAENAPAALSRSGRAVPEEATRNAHALWEDVVIEMEYCGQLLLEEWTDRAQGERHFLKLQQTLLQLFWILMDQDDQAWAADYTQRMLNAYRRHQQQHEGEGHRTPASTDTT